jgi:hypothetical protein
LSVTDLQKQLERQARELEDVRDERAALAGALRVISTSPGALKPVFQTILENATRICEAKFGNLFLYEGDVFRAVALHGAPPAFAERRRHAVMRPHPKSAHAQIVRTKQVVHIDDMRAMPAYHEGDPMVTALADLGRARTVVSVPMLKENTGWYNQHLSPGSAAVF